MGPELNASPSALPQPFPKQRMANVIEIIKNLLPAMFLIILYIELGSVIDALISGNISLPSLGYLSLFAVAAGMMAFSASFSGGTRLRAEEPRLRHAMVAQVFRLGVSERTKERSGRIVNSATDGVERSSNYRGTFIAPMLASLITPIMVVAVVSAFDWVSAAVLAISIPVVPLTVGAFQRAFRSVSTRYRAASRALAAQELDAIQGLSTLSYIGAGKRVGRTLAQAAENVRRRVMRYLAGNQIVLLVVDGVFSLGMITGATALAYWRLSDGRFSVGQAVTLVLLSSIMLDPLDRIGQFFYIGMGGIAATREIKRFTSETPEVVDPAEDGVLAPTVLPVPGEVRIDGLSFAYEADLPILENASLRIAPGEHIAITGTSGAGKSTLSSLIQAHHRPSAGSICINGVDISQAPLQWVRSQIAVVEQTTYLFSDTLRANILIANPAASDEDILTALRTVGLDDLLARLPEGLDTRVGDKGLALSGGEAQRVALARALIKDAPILLLDEPTAHVDLESERQILNAIDTVARGRTTITISHRGATIAHADRQVELKEGELR